jgi:hypothetical protein
LSADRVQTARPVEPPGTVAWRGSPDHQKPRGENLKADLETLEQFAKAPGRGLQTEELVAGA